MTEDKRYRRLQKSASGWKWDNPEFLGTQTLPGRFQKRPYASVAQAMAGEESPFMLSLNGEWDFKWFARPSDVPEDFFQDDFNASDWQPLAVPANWEIHGYGTPQYTDVVYPYSHDTQHPPAIDPNDNPTGCYRLRIDIPENWRKPDGDVILRFDGVRSAFEVWVNGQEAGSAQDSYSTIEFQVGRLLKPGANSIAVRVFKWSSGTYLEDQDMWRLSGIFRPVSLIAAPVGGLSDIFARCRFDSSFRDAQLDVTVQTAAAENARDTERILRWYLYSEDSADIHASCAPQSITLSDREQMVETSVSVNEPRHWSAEDPYLYRLVAELTDAEGNPVDIRILNFGFRQINIEQTAKGALFTVNGVPVKLRGVNRHNIHPRYGQAVPRDVVEADLIQMKRLNMNALRCSHYPNPGEVYDIADKLGLYIIDEANVESHGLRHKLPASRPEWRSMCVDRMERMVLAHRSHPCIIMWSLGNEAGSGKCFKAMKEAALALDTTRPIHYEGDHRLDTSDVFSLMYPTVEDVARIAKRRPVNVAAGEEGRFLGWMVSPGQYKTKPFMMCEFAHAMGNSLGGFSEYMDLVENTPHIFGAFIWDFADQALYKTDDDGTEYLAYGGDFGEEPHDGIFCANGIVTADRRLQPEAAEVRNIFAPIRFSAANLHQGQIIIANRQAHTDLSAFEITWNLELDGLSAAEGTIRKFDIAPGEEAQVHLYRDLALFNAEGEGFLTFTVKLRESAPWGNAGLELGRFQLPVPQLVETRSPRTPADSIFCHLPGEAPRKASDDETAPPPAAWNWKEDDSRLLVAASSFGARIRLDDAAVEALDFGQGNLLAEPLVPDFYRAPTDNEKNGPADSIYRRHWKTAAKDRRVVNHSITPLDDGLKVTFRLKVSGFLGTLEQTLIFEGDGRLRYTLAGIPRRRLIRFGTRGVLVGRLRDVSWFGLGPQECYRDRKAGAVVGQYCMDAAELSHEYLKPQESGNRTEVRRVTFADGGAGILFACSGRQYLDFSARFASREAVEEASHAHTLVESPNLHIHIDAGQQGVGGSLPGILALPKRHQMRALRRYKLDFRILRIPR